MNSQIASIGVIDLSRSMLESQRRKGKRLDIRVWGELRLAPDITPELIDAAVGSVSVRGRVTGPAAAVGALKARMR